MGVADNLLTKGLTFATTTMMLNSDAVISTFKTDAANGLGVNTSAGGGYWGADFAQLSPYQNDSIISEDFTESGEFDSYKNIDFP